MTMIWLLSLLAAPLVLSVAACTSVPETPMKTVANVDLERLMGDW
jgi:lipocalin